MTAEAHIIASTQVSGHEQVVWCTDERTGLRAVIAVHSTALGPALGGTRFHAYPDDASAWRDALNLAQGMSYKAAMAGLALGGGKAVILGDPHRHKTPELLRAYGRFVQSLSGRYITACDVGTYSEDMDVVAETCDFVTGRSVAHGGAGDSSVLTAYGVFQGLRAAAEAAWGSDSPAGRTVGVAGVGKVGHHLVGHLLEANADVVVADPHEPSLRRLLARFPEVRVTDPTALVGAEIDVYAPCALGGALDDDAVARLRARVVCGAANNQLAHPGIDKQLADRGVLYAPDYVVNAGGLIQVADELHGFDFERARARASAILDTTREVFTVAEQDGVAPATAADRIAERRIAEAPGAGSIWLPSR